MNTGALRQILEPRIRGSAHSPAVVRSLLSQAQRVLNAGLRVVTETTALSTESHRLVYNVIDLLPNMILVESVEHENRTLSHMANWVELSYLNRAWFRELGPQFDAWTMIGRDLLVLYPALDSASTVDVTYIKLVADLTGDEIDLELPDDRLPLVTALAEALLLTRERRYSAAQEAVKRLTERVGRERRVEE